MTDKEVNKLIEEIMDGNLTVSDQKFDKEPKVLPMVALRGKVLFPKTLLNFDVGRTQSIAAIEAAVKAN